MILNPLPVAMSLCLFSWTQLASGQEPVWWSASTTKIWQTSSVNTFNYAPVNIGQLKYVAARAKQHLDLQLAAVGGAGTEITSMVSAFASGPENHAIANVGQLKAVVAPFYRRFAHPSIGFNAGSQLRQRMGLLSDQSSVDQGVEYPWVAPNDGSHHAPACIGQLKLVFGFDLAAWTGPADTDLDGWSDVWEISVQTNPLDATSVPADDDDADYDGVSNYWERILGLNGGNSDSNANAVSDGLEDADQDGVKNNEDAHPASAIVAWRKSQESTYLVVPLPLPSGVSAARGYDLNNSGQAVGLGVPSIPDSTRPQMRTPILWGAGTVSSLTAGAIDNTGLQSYQLSPPSGNIVTSPLRWFAADHLPGATGNSFPAQRSIFIDDNGMITATGLMQANEQGQGWQQIESSSTAMRWNAPVGAPIVIGRTVPFPTTYNGTRYDHRIYSGVPLPGASLVVEKSWHMYSTFKYSNSPFTDAAALQSNGVLAVRHIEGIASDGYLTGQGTNSTPAADQSFIWSSLFAGSPAAALSPTSVGAVKAIARITNAPVHVHAAVAGGRLYDSGHFGTGYAAFISDKSITAPWAEKLQLSNPAPHNPAGIVTQALMNNNGVMVWDSETSAPPYYSEPFLWRNGKSYRLQNLLTSQNHTIQRVAALNNNGTMLANLYNGSAPVTPALLVPIQITGVSFGGIGGTKYWQLKSDVTDAIYLPPQWKDLDGNGRPTNTAQGERDYAVAFTRGTRPTIGATFKIANAANWGTIKIKATGSDGLAIPETVATVSGDDVTLPAATQASTPLVPRIKVYDKKDDAKAFKLEWEVKLNNSDWVKIGTTKHTVYVTLDDPKTLLRQESLFEISCRNADGIDQTALVTNAIWNEFTDRSVKRVDGSELTYYKNYNVAYFGTADLLKFGDGQCSAWAKLFMDLLKVQGIDGTNEWVFLRPPIGAAGMIVKNWNFPGAGISGIVGFPYLNVAYSNFTLTNSYIWRSEEVTDADGIPGQGTGNTNPASFFNNHQVVKIAGQYYDPSYGVKHASLQDLDNTIDGFFKAPGIYPVDEPAVNLYLNADTDKTDLGVSTFSIPFKKNPAGVDILEEPAEY